METWDAIRSRRDVREFDEEPIVEQRLERILEAGRRAPSSRNWQPWDFVLVTDRRRLGALAELWEHARHVARSVATIALVAPIMGDERAREIEQFDLGQVAMSMMIAAADLGIGSGHAVVRDQRLAGASPHYVRTASAESVSPASATVSRSSTSGRLKMSPSRPAASSACACSDTS